MKANDVHTIDLNVYRRGWKLLEMRLNRPSGVRAWFWAAWGFDIWAHKVPVLKSLIAANVLVWWLT